MQRLTTSKFIEKSINVHGNIYDYSKSVYVDALTKIEIGCNIHGYFMQLPHNHISGRGCSLCSGKLRGDAQRKTTESFIKEAINVHGEGVYDYSLVNYKNANSKIKIRCIKHNIIFEQRAGSHISGNGCPKCAVEKNSIPKRFTQDFFINKCMVIHENFYDYSLVRYVNKKNNIKIICPIHGIFEKKAGEHIRGRGCPKCAGRNKTTEEFIKQANNVHNNIYDYSQTIYTDANTKIAIICKIKNHGLFYQRPSHHLEGTGCPMCNSSKGEKLINQYLATNQINFYSQYKFKNSNINRCSFDFYLPNYRLLIEFNGGQHYSPVERFGGVKTYDKVKSRDSRKKDFAKRNHYNFLEIPYWSKNTTELIENEINRIKSTAKKQNNKQLKLNF